MKDLYGISLYLCKIFYDIFMKDSDIYERSLNFEVLALKQIGLIYFIPGHRSGLFKFFLLDYHTYSTKHCITCAVGLYYCYLLLLLQ